MSEAMPEPTLAIFGEQTISYTRVLGRGETRGRSYASETVSVPVDEIDALDDPRLRQALWDKYRVQTDPHARAVHFVTAHPDGSYCRTVSVPKEPLRLFLSDAAIEAVPEDPVPPQESARRRFFGRLFTR